MKEHRFWKSVGIHNPTNPQIPNALRAATVMDCTRNSNVTFFQFKGYIVSTSQRQFNVFYVQVFSRYFAPNLFRMLWYSSLLSSNVLGIFWRGSTTRKFCWLYERGNASIQANTKILLTAKLQFANWRQCSDLFVSLSVPAKTKRDGSDWARRGDLDCLKSTGGSPCRL